MAKKRVLLVDYEPKLLERLESMLADDRLELATAQDGFAAIEQFDRFQPDLVFLRTMLPKKHGFQVCQEMVERAGSRRVSIVMHCSIYKSRKYRNDAIKVYGAADYLEDPIEKDTLKDILGRFLFPEQGTSDSGTPARPEEQAAPAKAAPSPPPLEPVPAASRPKSVMTDVDKALEKTLSGMNLTSSRKPKTPSVEATIPLEDLLGMKSAGGTKRSSDEAERRGEPGSGFRENTDGHAVTSEELFGDVIDDVILAKTVPPPKAQDPGPSAPRKATGSERADELFSRASVSPMGEDSNVRRMKERAETDLSRKLEETLGGVRLGPIVSAAKPSVPEASVPAPSGPATPPPEAPPAQAAKAPPSASAERERARDEKDGLTYGNYILMEKIATGGMAELFKARQKGLEGFSRIVAIKRILPHLAANQDFVSMFIDEAKLAAQLNHPNVCHIYDLGRLEDSHFIAMEYVEGKDVRSILKELEPRKRLMPIRVVVYIAQKVCDALQYAHTARDMDGKAMDLVHRDISPQNILIATNGVVKLVDFGIAKAASKASHTQTGALKGKLLYMSPEQAWGKPIDARTDIFSLGVVICEMLSGQKLFYGDSEMSILERVREAKISSPRDARPDFPEDLERILLKALERDPAKRYKDCRAMQSDLERFALDEWETAPSAYDTAAFLNEIFPDVYTKEVLSTIKREPGVSDTGTERANEGGHKGGRLPKSQRGRPAPGKLAAAPPAAPPSSSPPPPPKKEPAQQAASALKKAEPKPASPPKQDQRPAPPKQAEPVPPAPEPESPARPPAAPPVEPSRTVPEEQAPEASEPGTSKRTLVMAAAFVAVVALAAILMFVFSRGSGTPQVGAPAGKAKAKAPAVETNAPPVQPQPPTVLPPAAPGPTEADVAAAKKATGDALTALSKTMTDIEQAGGTKYAPDAVTALKKSRQNAQALFQKAKTAEEFKAAGTSVSQVSEQASKVLGQIDQGKKDESAAAQKKAADEEAVKKEKDEADKKAQDEAAKKASDAAALKTKAGDLVELWAVDVKPKEIVKAKPEYTSLARSNKVQGTIYIEAHIDEAGSVTNARVVRGLNPDYGLNDAALRAALSTKYSPAIKDGVPVKTVYTYPVMFKIQ